MNNQQIESCVQRTVQGDTKAFEELYVATNQRVYFICLHFLKNEQDAKDALQDTYLSAYKNIRQLSDPSKFSSWVEHIAVNVCKNYLKKKNPSPVEDDTLLEILAAEEELILPDKYIDDTEKRRVLLEIMQNTLSDLQYRTIILYYFGNFTAPEIAEMMDCTEGAVKNRLATARGKIKKAIEEYQKDKDDKLFVFAGVPFLAKVFDEESKTLTVPALNTAMLTGSAAVGTTVSSAAGTAVKTGGIIMSKKILIGIIAGVVAVGAAGTAIGIAVANSNSSGGSTSNDTTTSAASVADTVSGSQDNTEQSDVAKESAVSFKIENTNPITTTDEELKPFLDYINEYVYTSDFDKPSKKNAHEFYLTTPDSTRQPLSLPGEIELDNSVKVKLRDSLSSICETPYITDALFDPEKKISGNYLNKSEFEIRDEELDLVKGKGNKIAYLYYKNLNKEDTEAQNCTIVELTLIRPTNTEPEIEYVDIKVGDSLEKVISTIGSPNYCIRFDTIQETTCDAYTEYTDSENKVSLLVHYKIDLTKDTDKAVVSSYSVYGYDLHDSEK